MKAFPTAEGFGAYAIGGRGGRIIKVTNLNDSGAGSLRAALTASGPRIVTFDVSGTITLNSLIAITNPFLTVAGQTSPGGVQLKSSVSNDLIQVQASNVIIRHMRLRPGYQTQPAGEQGAGIRVYKPTAPAITDIILDHCSVQWGNDDTVNFYSYYDRATLQWSLIAETTTAGVPVGSEGKALSWGRSGTPSDGGIESNLSIHHNIIATSAGRNPLAGWVGTVDFVNNVVYNWGSAGPPGYGGAHAMEFDNIRGNNQPSLRNNFVKNHYIPGPNSTWTDSNPYLNLGCQPCGTRLYLSGNFTPNFPSGTSDDWSNPWRNGDTLAFSLVGLSGGGYKSSTRFSAPLITETGTVSLKALLTGSTGVGAHKPFRDSVDTRILGDVNAGTGNIANIGGGGPWPTLAGGSPPADTDSDGIPDTWEVSHGLNKDSAADANSTAANGYTNIENYLNELAGDPIPGDQTPTPPINLRITSSSSSN